MVQYYQLISYYYLFILFPNKKRFFELKSCVITTHGLVKKTDKIPQSDLSKAISLMQLYFEQK